MAWLSLLHSFQGQPGQQNHLLEPRVVTISAGTILGTLGLFLLGLEWPGNCPAVEGTCFSSDPFDGNEHTGPAPPSFLSEVVLPVTFCSGPGPLGHLSGSVLIVLPGWQQASFFGLLPTRLLHLG